MKKYTIAEALPKYGKDICRIIEVPQKTVEEIQRDTIAEAAKIVAEWMPCIDCPMHCLDLQEDQCAENWALYLTDKLESLVESMEEAD